MSRAGQPAHRAQHACLDTEPRGTRRPTSNLDSALGFPAWRSGQCTWALRAVGAKATFAGRAAAGSDRARRNKSHVRCPHSISCVGLTLQEPSAQPRSRCAADILDLLYDVEGLNMCTSLPQHHAQPRAPAPSARTPSSDAVCRSS